MEANRSWLVIGLIEGKYWSAVVMVRPGGTRTTWARRCRVEEVAIYEADEFDQEFDRGEGITSALDVKKAQRPGEEQRRLNVDFPAWMIAALDREARRLGVTRQSVIKVWLADRLEHRATPAA